MFESLSLSDRIGMPAPQCSSPLSVTHSESLEPKSAPSEFTPPRSFNKIKLCGNLVVKSSSATSIHGELYFYQHIPHDLLKFFPRLHWHEVRNGYVSFAIDRVFGATFSSELLDGTLTNAMLLKFMRSLTELHRHRGRDESTESSVTYASYARKVSARFSRHKAEYLACGLSSTHFEGLLPRLVGYESGRRGHLAHVIHGDPVFTNVLATAGGTVKLIDMRGAQGERLTLAGDAVYDIGKVVQSLCGYDHVLAEKTVNGDTMRRLCSSQKVVRNYLSVMYEDIRWEDVVLVVCSLFTSLIPLHDNVGHRRRFAKVAAALLSCVRKETVGEEDIAEAVATALNKTFVA